MDATLALFEEEATRRIEELEHARGVREAREAAHSLHGLAAIAGCATLEQRAAALERSLEEGGAGLPALFATEVSALRAALTRLAGGGEPVVLFVDDDATSRRLLGVMLSTADSVALVTAESSVPALARRYRPGLILLDLHLGAENGLDVLQLLREESALAETRIVMLTAEDDPAAADRLLAAGADGYLLKPLDMQALLALLGG